MMCIIWTDNGRVEKCQMVKQGHTHTKKDK